MDISDDGRYKVEKNLLVLQEPGNVHLRHVLPISGSAQSIKTALLDFFTDQNIDFSKFVVVACDGTAVNTEHSGGVVCLLEWEIDRPLQWVVYQLHSNEFPLRYLIEHLDEPITGPQGFSWPIGLDAAWWKTSINVLSQKDALLMKTPQLTSHFLE
ncbi:hypothetical protein AVEN_133619-1 [Araneus ventricosus]|uniref:DUF4371 domain-containing protein n=1 Tax=Araneus ventricosus TaxID=182803 RepID=A0A4Y2UMD3_ARAVE|nr:hypothetical protein AVEN_31585-1 [Araneus ventricosus]GBO12720.1 hypothetical protein AVEN_133619-1 [Araneus ventricosus]